nr:hypothetical protein [Tanacetum cinerariifolium]
KASVSRASLPLTVISHRRCRLICYGWKSRGLSNPSSSGILPDGSCFKYDNSGNRDSGYRCNSGNGCNYRGVRLADIAPEGAFGLGSAAIEGVFVFG